MKTSLLLLVLLAAVLPAATAPLTQHDVIVYISYNLPVAYYPVEMVRLSGNTWVRLRTVDVTLRNRLDAPLTATLSALTITEVNGLPAPDNPRREHIDPVITFPLPAKASHTVGINPEAFNYLLLPGRPYLLRMSWEISSENEQLTITRVAPYCLPSEAVPVASAWAPAEDGVQARLQFDVGSVGATLAVELRNTTDQTITFPDMPLVEINLWQGNTQIKPVMLLLTVPPQPRPFALPAGAAISIPCGQAQRNMEQRQYRLSIGQEQYLLSPGQYTLNAGIQMPAPDGKGWILPPFRIVLPMINAVPALGGNPTEDNTIMPAAGDNG